LEQESSVAHHWLEISNDSLAKSKKLSDNASPENRSISWSVSSSISKNDGFFIFDWWCIFVSAVDRDRGGLVTEDEFVLERFRWETGRDRLRDRGGGGRLVVSWVDDSEEDGWYVIVLLESLTGISLFCGGEGGRGLRARDEAGKSEARFLTANDFAVIPPGLLRGLVVGGGERPTGIKDKSSWSEAAVEADRRENALLLSRSDEFSMLASSLATSAADNIGWGMYSEVDRAGLLGTGDPVSSLNNDCGVACGDGQGLNGRRWELRSERKLKRDWESSSVVTEVMVQWDVDGLVGLECENNLFLYTEPFPLVLRSVVALGLKSVKEGHIVELSWPPGSGMGDIGEQVWWKVLCLPGRSLGRVGGWTFDLLVSDWWERVFFNNRGELGAVLDSLFAGLEEIPGSWSCHNALRSEDPFSRSG
jgi:hypothetical protein